LLRSSCCSLPAELPEPISFDTAPAVAEDLAMPRNLTNLLFTDGLWHVVWEEPGAKLHVIVDDDGTREDGGWYIPHRDEEKLDLESGKEYLSSRIESREFVRTGVHEPVE
jgi:hypothetical protein